MFEKYLEEVSKTSLFQGIEREDISAMLNCLKPRVCGYNRNDYIVTGGDAYESVGIVLKGAATVSKENAAGNMIVMTLLKQGDIFGEIIAFSNQMTWPATVQAQETCVVLFLTRGKISTYLLEQYSREGDVNINLPLNRNELSDFLNVSRPSMSREMSKMRDEGIINFHLTAVKIMDIEGLKHICAL